jgi:hypothetical protein
MISELFAALLFLFISLGVGYYINLLVNRHNQAGFFACFLSGVAAQIIYLDTWSLFLPTNYLALIVPVLVSLYAVITTSITKQLSLFIRSAVSKLFSRQHAAITCSFLLVLFLFCLVTPYNEDSAGYHYLSILWSEKYKVIPGLANLSAKYGTHSPFFVLCAAYSFTDVLGQSIYPANFIIVPLFFLWVLYKSYDYQDARKYFLWAILLVLCRYVLINIASPSPDAPSTVLLFYILFCFYDGTWRNKIKIIVLLCFTAVILKLNVIPVLLVIPYVLWVQRKNSSPVGLVGWICFTGIITLIPWIARGVFISGYPLFPSTFLDLFNVDWKVPANIAEAEKTHIVMAPRMLGDDYASLKNLNAVQWVPQWFRLLWKHNVVNGALVSLALSSPLFWLVNRLRNIEGPKVFLFFLSYAAIWFWILTSPDIRFGVIFKLFCIFLPLSGFLKNIGATKLMQIFAGFIIVMAALYYSRMAIGKTPHDLLSKHLILPPRDVFYYKKNDLSTFRYIMLNNNVKLYVYDSMHHSINAPLPVYSAPQRQGIDTSVNIQMRGLRIVDGFRYAKR